MVVYFTYFAFILTFFNFWVTPLFSVDVPKHGSSFFADGNTLNESRVGFQLDSIVNPTESEAALLNELASLALPHIQNSLNQMSGEQHTSDFFIIDGITRQFIRRLYDPLRPIVTKDPCLKELYEKERDSCFCPLGGDLFVEGSGDRTSQEGSKKNKGYRMDGVEGTLAIQKTCFNKLTLGVAGSYQYEHCHYQLGGSSNLNTIFGGVYALYRPEKYYFLVNAAYGEGKNKFIRLVQVGPIKSHMHSNPLNRQSAFYGEVGIDYNFEDLLIQPFVGLQWSRYERDKIIEEGPSDLNLTIQKRKETFSIGRLGLHLSSLNLPSDFELSVDMAWNFRSKGYNRFFKQQFNSLGSSFFIEGIPLTRHYFDGAMTLSQEIYRNISVFGKLSGEISNKFSSYCFAVGVDQSF